MKDEDSIAITIIRAVIEGLERKIERFTGKDNIRFRIALRGKILMLSDIIKSIEETSKVMNDH